MKMMPEVDPLILGVNPFSNVNHFLRERARDSAMLLGENRILETFRSAFEAGARGFNFSVSDCSTLRYVRACGYTGEIGMYPMIPDTQSYVSAQLAKGTMSVIMDVLGSLNWSARVKAAFEGGLSLVTADPIRALRLFLDIEINKLRDMLPENVKIKTVLLDESVTDIAVALGASDLCRTYIDHLWDHHKLLPGFVTRNFPFFVDFCERSRIQVDRMVIMTPFNSRGFQMNPDREACEQVLAMMKESNVIAMSVMAGGQVGLKDAVDYLSSLKNLKSVVAGVSSPGHAHETFSRLSAALGET